MVTTGLLIMSLLLIVAKGASMEYRIEKLENKIDDEIDRFIENV